MKSFAIVTILCAVAGLSTAQTTERAAYDPTYDNADGNMNSVSCGDQLFARFPTFDSLPSFPRISGTAFINNSSSPNCGSCRRLGVEGSRLPFTHFTAIDVVGEGFNLSEESMLALTGEDGISKGSAEITAVPVPAYICGIFSQ